MVLASSHNSIKITTKLQNNHYSESPEIKLSESPTTPKLKKKPHQEWRGGRVGPTPTYGG